MNFVKEISELIGRKERELGRRSSRADTLLELSELTNNKEQSEAYQKCIGHQHQKMIDLMHSLSVIRSALESIGEGNNDEYTNEKQV